MERSQIRSTLRSTPDEILYMILTLDSDTIYIFINCFPSKETVRDYDTATKLSFALDTHCLGWGLCTGRKKLHVISGRSLSPFLSFLPYFSPQHLTQSDMLFILLIYLFFVWLPRPLNFKAGICICVVSLLYFSAWAVPQHTRGTKNLPVEWNNWILRSWS